MHEFRRRTYRRWGQLWSDLRFLARRRSIVLGLLRGKPISPAFRERLMLTVTAVNDCRYCAHLHSRLALRAGLSPEDSERLLGGTVEPSPVEERVALQYARHWAERDALPDPDARARLVEVYCGLGAEQIEVVLHLIRLGNLTGNTWDFLLYRLSGGRLGLGRQAPTTRRGAHRDQGAGGADGPRGG